MKDSRNRLGFTLYRVLIALYPKEYKIKYKEVITQALLDVAINDYKGRPSVFFWVYQYLDLLRGLFSQYMSYVASFFMKAKRSRALRVTWKTGLTFTLILGLALGINTLLIYRQQQIAVAAEWKHLPYACTLFPLNKARQLIGSDTYLENGTSYGNSAINYSGVDYNKDGVTITHCNYVNSENTNNQVLISVHQTFTSVSTSSQRYDFFHYIVRGERPMTFEGHYGFSDNESLLYSLRIWYKNTWIGIQTQNSNIAHKVMNYIIHQIPG